MLRKDAVTLREDGAFIVPGKGADCILVYNHAENDEWSWFMVYVSHSEGAVDQVLMKFEDFETALRVLASQRVGGDEDKFNVYLPDGRSFSRPGRIPAAEVLSRFGYVLVQNLIAFAIYDCVNKKSEDEVTLEIRSKLSNCDVTVGRVEKIDPVEGTWCVDLTVPFQGYLDSDGAIGVAREYVEGSGLEVAEVVEFENFGINTVSESVVLKFTRAA